MGVVEVRISSLGTGTLGISQYVAMAIEKLETSSFNCTLGSKDTMVDGRRGA
jgi:uncharacterized protein YqgV (UPF0045/DUF77 family)